MKGLKRFETAIIKIASRYSKELMEEHEQEFKQVLENELLDSGRRGAINSTPTPSEEFFIKVFSGFTEILDSTQILEDIVTYIRRIPYSRSGVSRLRYLRFVVEAYLNEVYLLKERLIALLNVLKKAYRKTSREKEVLRRIQSLFTSVSRSLINVSQARDSHVHATRYSDREIDRLSLLEILSKQNSKASKESGALFKTLYKLAYQTARENWVRTVKTNDARIKKLLDVYFDLVFSIVFDKDSKMLYPTRRTG
jgi:hypothetical protein